MSALIDIRDVTKTYEMGAETIVHALDGVSLSIEAGDYVAIMGPSGSGKSTLMNLIGCLDTPSTGSYVLKGREISAMNDDELAQIRNKEIGFIFQTFNLLPRADAVQNVELPLVYSGLARKERKARAEKALDAVLLASGYEELRAEQAKRRAEKNPVQLGIGVSTYVEVTAPVGLHIEFGAVEIHDDGSASVFAGTSVHGQGHHTAFAMLATEVLGIPMDKIKLVNSDTDLVPRGAGTMGSRSLQTAGSAIFLSSKEVFSRAQKIAAHLLEAAPEDIVAEGGSLHVAGTPSKSISWAELAVASRDQSKLPEGLDASTLRHELDFDGTNSTFPFGAHVSVVEVDTETGKVVMRRHIAVDDCGRILNPMLVTGQQHGGIAQGAAQALYEWVRYDEDGNPVTGTLLDYTVPSAAELPSFETSNTQTDSPRNPLGAKGIGESGTIGSTPAIQNAVVDALSHLGVVHIDMPCTPERVWSAIHAA